MGHAVWPLADLEVVTPQLALRYISDDLGVELALLAANGIHDPATMPFSTPWTDAPSSELKRNTLPLLLAIPRRRRVAPPLCRPMAGLLPLS
jgi:hypothetical protein